MLAIPHVAIQDFDVRDKRIIAITFSFNDFLDKRIKQKDPSTTIKYTLVEMNLDGEVLKKICEISAVQIDCILFSSSANRGAANKTDKTHVKEFSTKNLRFRNINKCLINN